MIKKVLILIMGTLMLNIGFAQTAVNFNCNDCSGVNHDLFSELDAGKVVVMCWVMPCGSCVGPTLTTYNVVSSFEATHPGQVVMYLVDDFANTNCTSISSWASSNGINPPAMFSNADIKMSDYGRPGMPMVVVVGDVNHAVFYYEINTVNADNLQAAINTAIEATSTGVEEVSSDFTKVRLYPNPSVNSVSIQFSLKKPSDINIEIHDQTGKLVSKRTYAMLPEGENEIGINTSELENGIYFVKLSNGISSKGIKVTVTH